MDEARIIIDRLRSKIVGVVADRNRLENDLLKVETAKENLKQDKEELEKRVTELEQRIRVLELSKGMLSVSSDAKSARERVNRLLREVDKCIALLNR